MSTGRKKKKKRKQCSRGTKLKVVESTNTLGKGLIPQFLQELMCREDTFLTKVLCFQVPISHKITKSGLELKKLKNKELQKGLKAGDGDQVNNFDFVDVG
ncbi:unnamed protein product [Lactuca virosa]|uniref:Uncharacterized protein n=1 Tax=Lactuca virosa TaxID=75947 RepID=A0AAU9M8C7_9ASTR|nr:unnamed protein product [Lactuca virosa]